MKNDDEIYKDIVSLLEKREKNLEEIYAHTKYLSDMYNNFVYNNPFEYSFLKERWEKIDEWLSKESYERLIEGLDSESVKLVSRTLERVKKILPSNGKPIDLFSRGEMDELYFFLHTYIKSIIKISENIYAYENYFLPINHFEKGIFVDQHGINFLNNERFKNKAIVDVGAFIGDSACVLSKRTNDKVYSFEALKENYDLMLKTIEYNHLDNVVPINLALGETNGKAQTINLYEKIANGSCCQVQPVENELALEDTVSVITLDEFVKKNHLNVGLIKVDIEGSEQQFLQGAKETIIRQNPSLIMSVYHNPNDFFNIKKILNEWVPEYKFKLFKPVDNTAILDTTLLCEVEKTVVFNHEQGERKMKVLNKLFQVKKEEYSLTYVILGIKIKIKKYYKILKYMIASLKNIENSTDETKSRLEKIETKMDERKRELDKALRELKEELHETKKIVHGFWIIEYFKKYGMKVPIENSWCSGDWDIIEIALGEIKFGDEKRTPLSELPAYQALQNNDMEIYRKWISTLARNKTDENLAVEKLKKTYENVKENGYKLNEGVVLLFKDNSIIDGHHRCCCLLHLYGPDYKILCLRAR